MKNQGLSSSTGAKKKRYKTWEKSFKDPDIEKRFCVKECDNGYYIEYEERDAESYECITSKKYISTTNPLENKAKELPDVGEMLDTIY